MAQLAASGDGGVMEQPEKLPQPASHFRMSYCSYCIHERQAHIGDGVCIRCILEGNGFWPLCPAMTRTARTPEERGMVNPRRSWPDADFYLDPMATIDAALEHAKDQRDQEAT